MAMKPNALMMIQEEFVTEIVPIVPPNRMNVITTIYSVVELDQDLASLNSIVVRGPQFLLSRPREPKILDTILLYPSHLFPSNILRHTIKIAANEIHQDALLPVR